MTTIAFAGLGSMGLPMAKNLLAAGHAVRGIDLNPVALATLAEAGGQPADAVFAASGADVLILMVVNAAQAEQVLFDNGALEALADNGIVCLMATCPPAAVERIAARVSAAGRRFVDAPVSGGTTGAIAGSLTIMAACERATFEAVQPVFEGIGQRIFHVGERAGQGATVKVVNQLLCGVHIAVVAEAFALAAKVGVDLPVLLEIMGGSAASSWMLKDRGPRMLQAEPEVSSAVDIFVKDLGLVLDMARASKFPLPLSSTAHQMFMQASTAGFAREDDSAVIKIFPGIVLPESKAKDPT